MRALAPLVALTLALPAFAQTKQERAGIVNFTQVDAVVACGGATETTALDGLATDGFKAVINLRRPTEQGADLEQNAAHARSLGLTYISIPFNGQQPDSQAVDDFLAAVADEANRPVFVHCASASRVGAMWLVKRVLQDGWAVDKATEEAKLIGLRSETLEAFALEYINSHRK